MRGHTFDRRVREVAASALRKVRRITPAWPGSIHFRWLMFGGLRMLVLVLLVASCAPTSEAELVPRQTLFIGIDVSGSFQNGGRYDDAIAFAARYIHGHLNGLGKLEEPRAMFVGSIGGETPGEPQAFHPIHDFEGKSAQEIEVDLRRWFAPDDRFTDFNAFFQRAATLVKRQNLVLAPVTLVLFTDGVPDLGALPEGVEESERYAQIDLEPLEYLARNVTIRVLYPDPTVAVAWERQVPRDRVRMWTVDEVVMKGWRDQLREPEAPEPVEIAMAEVPASGETPGGDPANADIQAADAGTDTAPDGVKGTADSSETGSAPAEVVPEPAPMQERWAPSRATPTPPDVIDQPDLWRWIKDNVDFRVRRTVL